MKKYKLNEEAIAINKKIWLGIDAHKKTLHITVIDSESVLHELSVPHSREHVEGLIGKLPGCEIVAVYESGPTGYSLLHWLNELGCDAFITPVSKVPESKGRKRIKTDRRDSRELAEFARAGLLKEVFDLGEEHYRQRELTRTRQQLVDKRSKTCNQIKSKLLYHGVELPEGLKQNWSNKYLSWLASAPSGDEHLDLALQLLVETHRELTAKIKRLTKAIEKLAETDKFAKDVEIITSTPQIGMLTAMVFLLELGDISRFTRAEEFSSFLGLIPGEWSSGERTKKGSRIRWGNRRARSALVEAAWRVIGDDPKLKKTYERIKYRRGSGRAIVAVARRLGLILRAMLREGKKYNYPGAKPQKEHEQND